MKALNRKIILSSKSPRRSFLLKQAGFDFEVKTKEVAEDYPADMPVDAVAPYLARKKALAAADFITEDEIILASDCVVVLDDVIYGKPTDYADAVRILKTLSGKVHRVITGICLLSKEKEMTLSDVSKVYMDDLSAEEIDFYIRHYQPFDKAGAYAIQEWIGLCKISKIEGSYANIMGLPVHLVYKALQAF